MSAQPYFRSRAQRRDRDAELERLVAAELDACDAPLDNFIEPPPAPANSTWTSELSAAERDFVDLVRQWLDRRPNKHQLMHLICEGVAFADSAPPAPQQAVQDKTSVPTESSSHSPAEPDSHAAP
jgi:hypothetical protein